jgi:rhamnosyltransferase
MVSSGLRKDIWSRRGFREDLQYAEDDEYTRWCKARGLQIVFIPESIVMHSHNYTLEQSYKRSYGDARAIGKAWKGSPSDFNWLKTVLLGWLSDARHDVRFCVREKCLAELSHALRTRWQQRKGKLAGFRQGWSEGRSL